MALYIPPQTHVGTINPVFNPTDYQFAPTASDVLDSTYLNKAKGGTIIGSTTFSKTITLPSITLSSNTNTQTTNQIGFYQSVSKTISEASITNSTTTL